MKHNGVQQGDYCPLLRLLTTFPCYERNKMVKSYILQDTLYKKASTEKYIIPSCSFILRASFWHDIQLKMFRSIGS